MYNQYIDENNLTFPQELQGQGSIQRKFLQVFREQISNLQKVLSHIQVGMAEQTSNNCICKGPLARFWSNLTTQPMSQLICVVAYGERYEIGGGGAATADAESCLQAHQTPCWHGGVGWAAHSQELGQLYPCLPCLWRDSPGGAHASLAEENAEMEAKLCPSSTGAAIAAERQG